MINTPCRAADRTLAALCSDHIIHTHTHTYTHREGEGEREGEREGGTWDLADCVRLRARIYVTFISELLKHL